MIADKNRNPREFLEDHNRVREAIWTAVRDALRQHKAAGNPIATWKDGRVVWIPAKEIRIEEDAG